MLPRPRLVCQEPGLRPIGRSPGVPDKSSRGLGSMSRYSAQILICFIAYIFSIFNFSVGLQTCRTATMHSAPCHCSLLSEWGCSVLIRQSNLPACLAEGQQEETLSGIHATELVKLADKMDEICISGKFSVQESSKWRFLLHTCEKLYCISAQNLDWFQECWLFWKLIRSRIWQLPDNCQTGVWKSFSGK